MTRPIARLSKILAAVLAAAILLVVLTLLLLATGPGERWALRSLVRLALVEAGATLTARDIDLEPWRLRARLEGVTVRRDSPEADLVYALEVDTVRAGAGADGRLRIDLSAPVLTMLLRREAGARRPATPSLGERLERGRIARLTVDAGTLLLLDDDGAEAVRLDDVDLALDRSALRRYAAEGSAELRMRAAEERWLEAGGLRVTGEIAGAEIHLARAHLERAGADLTARGTLRQSPDLDGTLEADFHLASEVVRELFPQLRATGEVDGTARLALDAEGLRIEADFDGAGLYWDAFGPFAAGGQLRLAERRLDLLDGSLVGYGGRADLTAGWDLERDRQSLAIEWTGVDLDALAAGADRAPLPVEARTSGEARLATEGFDLDSTTGEAAVKVQGRARRGGVPLAASAQTRIEGRAIEVTEGGMDLGPAHVDASGRVSADGALDGSYRLDLRDLGRLGEVAAMVGAPAPPLDVAGSLEARGELSGTIEDPRWTATVERQSIRVAGEEVAVEAVASGDRRSLALESLSAHAGGGRIRLTGGVTWQGATALALRLEVDAVDLCALLEHDVAPACGVLHASGTVSGALDDPRWTIAGDVSDLRSRDAGVLARAPGLLRFRAKREDGRIVVEELRGILDGGAVEGEGSYDVASRHLEGRLRITDLPLESVLPEGGRWGDVAGKLALDATFEGPPDAPRGDARVSVRELGIEGRPLPDVDGTLHAGGSGDLEIEAGAVGAAPFLRARLELERPYLAQADLDLGAIPRDAIVNLLHDLPHRLSDPVIGGRVAIDAVLARPIEIHVRGEIERLAARYGRLRLAAEPFSIAGDREGLRIEALRLTSDGSTLLVSGTLPLGNDRELDLRATGDLPLEVLATPNLALDGVAHLDVAVVGRWLSPSVSGQARVIDASGRFGAVDWQGVSLEARLAERQVFLEAAQGRILGGTFTGRGEMVIEDPLESSDVEIVLDVAGIDLALLAPELPSRPRPFFLVDAEATLTADRLDLAAAGGWIDLLAVRAGADGNQMTTLEPTRVLVAEGRATLPEIHLVGGGTDIRVEGETSLVHPLEDIQARVLGDVDFAQLGFLAASLPGLEIGGLGTIDLEIRHGAGGFELVGGGAIESGRLASVRPRFVLSDIVGEVAFRGSAIRLRQLRGRLGGGTVEARASIDLENLSTLESVVLEAEASEVNLTFGEGVRARFSGDALFQGRRDNYRLKGDLRILSGLFTREIDAATSEREFLAGIRAELAEEETAPFAETVVLAVRLTTEGDVYVDNELTRVTAGGNLRLEGTLAQPELVGVVTNTSEGILRLGRNVFNLELARITLEGYPIEPPLIEVAATTEVAGHSVRLELEGTPDDVDTTLTSTDPELTQGDLAALLTTGRTADAAPEGAASLLEARAAAYLGELFQEQLGLGLVFDTPAALPILSSETGPENRFTVGRRLTDQLTVAYSAGVEDDSSLWIVDYQPLRRLWFRAIEENGEAFTFEIAQRLTFDPGGRSTARSEPSRIRSVEIVSADPARPLPPLERRLKVKPGKRYDYWKAEDAAEELRRALADLGYLGAQVEVQTEAASGRDVALRLVIDTGLPVRFRWLGDDPGKELAKRIEREWGSHLPPGLLVAELATRATHELRADGWYLARVFGSVAEEDAVRIVELEVRLGPRGKGVDLDFAGSQALADDELARVLPDTDDQRFFAWIGEDPGRIDDAIALRYAEEGFLDVAVGEVMSVFDDATGRLRVEIPVREELRYTVEVASFPGADSLSHEMLAAALPLRVGEPFSLSAYREASRELRRLYRRHGFPDVSVRTRVRRIEPGALEILFLVEEGDPAVVGGIEITGHARTREQIIRRRIGLETGAPLRLDQLAAAERELYRLGVFRSVEVVARDPLPGTFARDVVVRVIEKPGLSFDYGLRYRTDDVENLQPTVDEVKTKGLEAVLRTQILQPFRTADSMILSLFGGEERRRARLGYQIPHFFGRWLPTEVSVEAGKEARERFDIEIRSRSAQLTLQQRKSLSEQTRLLYGVQLERGRIDSVAGTRAEIPSRRGDWVDLNRLTVSMVHDRRDDLMDPRRGFVVSGTVQGGSPWIGAETEFSRVNGQWSLFVPLGRSDRAPVWASSYRAGGIWSGDPFVDPFLNLEDRFTAGGPFSVRGFEANTLGPRFPADDGFPIGGRAVVIMNQELRFPIWDDLWGGAFYDTGNVFGRPEDVSLDGLRESVGVGLRYDLGFGVLRVDVARVLDRQPGEAKERVHLSFGHAF